MQLGKVSLGAVKCVHQKPVCRADERRMTYSRMSGAPARPIEGGRQTDEACQAGITPGAGACEGKGGFALLRRNIS